MHGTGAPLGRFTAEVPDEAHAAAADVARVLKGKKRILVMGHVGADGDVAGSSLAIAAALRERGAEVVVYNPLPYPTAFAWLPGGDSIVHVIDDDAVFDATVVVDAADPARCGDGILEPARRGTFVWIDHHRIEAPPGDVNFIDLTSAAVGEQVVLVLDALEHPLSVDVAKCVYASLLSDTGGFRYANTSARALRLAARLVEAGVSPWEMTEHIYESQDEARTRLIGHVLSSFWRSTSQRFAVGLVSASDLMRAQASHEHVQGIVNHLRAVRGIEIAALVCEASDGTRVFLRGKGKVPCAPIAEALGFDSAHKNAATFTLADDAVAVHDRLTAVFATVDARDGFVEPKPLRAARRRPRRALAS